MPGTVCGAGREAELCLLAGLAEMGGRTGRFAGAVDAGGQWTAERMDRGQGVHPEGSHRHIAIFVLPVGGDKRLYRCGDDFACRNHASRPIAAFERAA